VCVYVSGECVRECVCMCVHDLNRSPKCLLSHQLDLCVSERECVCVCMYVEEGVCVCMYVSGECERECVYVCA